MKPAREPASSRPKPCAFLKKPHESCPFAAPCGPRRKKNDRGVPGKYYYCSISISKIMHHRTFFKRRSEVYTIDSEVSSKRPFKKNAEALTTPVFFLNGGGDFHPRGLRCTW